MGMPKNGCNANSHSTPSITGIILVDGTGRPIYYNCEALAIMTYPKRVKNVDSLGFLAREVRSLLRLTAPDGRGATAEFTSGRRSYVCRASALNGNSETHSRMVTGLFMERATSKAMDVSKVAERFHLSQREKETIGLLALGLTSKEIAVRMNISPNTVKTFFRLVMTKMGVNTRSGIVGKIARI
jgi:DNA-binding CsgD family transcriptional regulator